jgi:hypothetical protein
VSDPQEWLGRRLPKDWPVAEEERLVLVVLGQDYLRQAPEPRPLPYRQAAEQLKYLRPAEAWGEKRIALTAARVGERLTRGGDFPYHPLTRQDGRDADDATLLHNLIRGLVDAATLVPPDLVLLDGEFDG